MLLNTNVPEPNLARLLLPLWAQRDFGKWSVFGGGGYVLNPGAGQRDYLQQGVVVTRQMAPGFQLGLEYYGAGPASIEEANAHRANERLRLSDLTLATEVIACTLADFLGQSLTD